MFKINTPKRRKCLSKWEEVSPAVPKLGLACSSLSSLRLLRPYLTRKPNTVVMSEANNGDEGREGVHAVLRNRTTHAHFDIRSIDLRFLPASSSLSASCKRASEQAHIAVWGGDVVHYVFREGMSGRSQLAREAKTVAVEHIRGQ